MSKLTGTYAPNEAGARNLAEAKPLYVGDDRVTAQVSGDHFKGHTIAVFVGVSMIHEAPLPYEIRHAEDVNPFVRSVVKAYLYKQNQGKEIDYPRMLGAFQGKMDGVRCNINTLYVLYGAELRSLPDGAQNLLQLILKTATEAYALEHNPITK